jgi:Flp pilus assembly protein TadG
MKRPGRFSKQLRRGAAMVETAFVLPVFILLVFGLLESSRLGMVSVILTTAAREGCRVAVVDGNTNTDVTNRINAVLASSNITNVTTVQVPTDCTTVHSGDSPNTVQITLSVPYNKVTWLGTPYIYKTATVTGTATLSSERP